jgi:hypothetical protein
MYMKRRVTVIAIISVATVLATATSAYAATVGSWYFGAAVAGSPVNGGQPFSDSTGTVFLNAADTTTLTGTDLDTAHPKSIRFPGWQGTPVGGTVNATTSMMSTDANFETGGGSDGTSVVHDPESQLFSVSAWILPDNASQYPLGTAQPSSVSPNIVQKGVSTSTGSFWKMSLGMTGTGTAARWYPFCQFKSGTTFDVKPGSASADRYPLTPGVAYKIECSKSGATATLKVFAAGSSTAVATRTATASSAFSVSNGNAVSVGKKPTSTDPADAFAGVVDNVLISKGA